MTDAIPETRRGRTIRTQWARERERRRISQHALRKLAHEIRRGPVSEWALPFVRAMEGEARDLMAHVGGIEEASEVERSLIHDASVAFGLMQACAARAMQGETVDLEATSRFSSLAGTRARLLGLLGLQRRQRAVPTLAEYLREREARDGQPDGNQRSEPAIGGHPRGSADDPQPVELGVRDADGRVDAEPEPEGWLA